MLGGEHCIGWITTFPFPEHLPEFKKDPHWRVKGDVVIGNDVWIGHGACLLSGVTIGDGAVVGAWAVVAKDIPPYAIAVGNPARVIKYRFSEDVIKRLMEVKWWDLPDEKINALIPLLLSNRIDEFFEAV